MPGRIPAWRRFLEARTVVILVLFLLPALDQALEEPVAWEEAETLLYARQFADPEFLPGDWYLNLSQGVRRPYQVLVYPLAELFPLPVVSVLARLAGYLVVAGALGLIATRLGFHAGYAAVIVGAFLWLGQSLVPGQEWIFRRTESKIFGYGLTFFALYALLARRLALAGLLAGAATTLHVIVGGWGTVALALTALSRRIGSWRERLTAGLAWCASGSVALYLALARLLEPGPSASFDAERVYVYFRNPHHNDVSVWTWPDGDWVPVAAGLLVLGVLVRAARARSQPDSATVAHFALWTLLPFACGLLVSPLPWAAKFLHYYPFRVASTVVLLFGLLLAVPATLRWLFREQALPLVLAGLGIFFFVRAGAELADDVGEWRALPEGGVWQTQRETRPLLEACTWIRENTEPGSLLISSPYVDSVPYLCRRPVAVTFRMAPSGAADLEEWYRRLVDFNGGEPPRRRGYAAAREIDRNFRRLSTETYRELGRAYGGDYLLVERRRRIDLPRLFRNRDWAVYALGEPEEPAADPP